MGGIGTGIDGKLGSVRPWIHSEHMRACCDAKPRGDLSQKPKTDDKNPITQLHCARSDSVHGDRAERRECRVVHPHTSGDHHHKGCWY
jgi:hypothetical protein